MATRRAAAKAKESEPRSARSPRPAARPARVKPAHPREFRDEIVLEKTGRTREAWFTALDAFGAADRGHTATAAHLASDHGVSPWWSQAITVEYERARGIRSFGERADGFAFTVQRALAVPAERVWQAFADDDEAAAWRGARHRQQFSEGGTWRTAGGDHGEFRRIVDGRFVRFTWGHGRRAPDSVVEVQFVARAVDRSTVKLTHRRIRSAEEREELRAHWSWALDSLKSFLETGAPVPHHDWVAART